MAHKPGLCKTRAIVFIQCGCTCQVILPNGAKFLILLMNAFLRQDLAPGLAFFAERASLFKTVRR